MIIGISGKKQSGKTTAKRAIEEWVRRKGNAGGNESYLGVTTCSFAQSLKEIVRTTLVPASLHITIRDMDREDIKNIMLPCALTIREALQKVGTDWFRTLDSEAWLNAWESSIPDYMNVVIVPDVRFPNELEAIHKRRGRVIKLLRAPFAHEDEHLSEIALDHLPDSEFDYVVDNQEMDIPKQNQAIFDIMDKMENEGCF